MGRHTVHCVRSLIPERACNSLTNPPCGIGAETKPFLGLVLLYRAHQTDDTFLKQVQERQTAARIAQCNGQHESDVSIHDQITRTTRTLPVARLVLREQEIVHFLIFERRILLQMEHIPFQLRRCSVAWSRREVVYDLLTDRRLALQMFQTKRRIPVLVIFHTYSFSSVTSCWSVLED